MYNKVIMVGNLTRNIELRYLPSGSAIAKSAIATSFKFKSSTGEQKDEVCFLDFNIFGRSAEVANQYLKKGSKVLLEGRLVFEQWTAQDGSTRSRHSLRVDSMKMLDSKGDSSNHDYQEDENRDFTPPQQQPQQQYQKQQPQQQYQKQQPQQQPQQQNRETSYNQEIQKNIRAVEKSIPDIDVDEDEIPF